jgi:hypothetical protein
MLVLKQNAGPEEEFRLVFMQKDGAGARARRFGEMTKWWL